MVEIEIFGTIVSEKTKPNQITLDEIRQQMEGANGEEITFLINSGGGSVFDGAAIMDAMDRYPSTINAHIMGICGSMATPIASKAQYVSMNSNAFFMIHNPRTPLGGTVDQLEMKIKLLNSMTDSMVSIYMSKTGRDESTIREAMNKTTYMSAEEALSMGFVDEITDAVEMTAEMEEFILGMDDSMPEQARAYFKHNKLETNMSEEKQERGILDQIVALIKGDKQEPVQEEVVAEVAIDFEAKFNELDVEMKAQLEAKDVELAELAKSHEDVVAQLEADHKAQLEEVVAKVEVVAKAFEDGKLSVVEAKEELKSEAKADEVEADLKDVEDKFSAEADKEDLEKPEDSKYSVWMSMTDIEARQAYFQEHEADIMAEYEKSQK